jgi:hypothetical protein
MLPSRSLAGPGTAHRSITRSLLFAREQHGMN